MNYLEYQDSQGNRQILPTGTVISNNSTTDNIVYVTQEEYDTIKAEAESDPNHLHYKTIYAVDDGDNGGGIALPGGVMSRRQMTDGIDFTIDSGPLVEKLAIGAQEVSGSAWASMWWSLGQENTSQESSSGNWLSNGSGGMLRAPHTFDLLQDVYIDYSATSSGGEIKADFVEIDLTNNRRAIAKFNGIDGLMDIEVELSLSSCCCLQNSPHQQIVSYRVVNTIGDFSATWSSFSFSMQSLRMTYNTGYEFATNYFAVKVIHVEPLNVMEELFLEIDIQADMEFDGNTMIPAHILMSFDTRRVMSTASMRMTLKVDMGLIMTGTPSGELVEIQSPEIMEIPQVWDGNVQLLKIHLGGGAAPKIDNIDVLNAIKTEVVSNG